MYEKVWNNSKNGEVKIKVKVGKRIWRIRVRIYIVFIEKCIFIFRIYVGWYIVSCILNFQKLEIFYFLQVFVYIWICIYRDIIYVYGYEYKEIILKDKIKLESRMLEQKIYSKRGI